MTFNVTINRNKVAKLTENGQSNKYTVTHKISGQAPGKTPKGENQSKKIHLLRFSGKYYSSDFQHYYKYIFLNLRAILPLIFCLKKTAPNSAPPLHRTDCMEFRTTIWISYCMNCTEFRTIVWTVQIMYHCTDPFGRTDCAKKKIVQKF